jgi:protein gp37
MTGQLKIHPVAAKFPALADEEFQQLVVDIKANGQHAPIALTADGSTIVDGINRWKACKAAGVEPKFRNLPKSYDELDIINFVISANFRRRDLSAGQKAMIAEDIAPELEAAARERQAKAGGDQKSVKARKNRKSVALKGGQAKKDRAGRTDHQVAKAAGIGHATVSRAKKVKASSPRLAANVSAGTISLNDAYKQVRRKETASPVVAENEVIAVNNKTTIVRTHDGQTAEYKLPKGKAKFNATNDQVSWAAWTWNPVTGCLHNCKYCYAREGAVMNKNLAPFYPFGFTPTFYDYRLEAPANSKVPENVGDDARLGRVFVTSMGDLFGKWVPDEWIKKVLAAARNAPEWEYLFLTKFPQRYVELDDLPSTAWIGTTVDDQYRVKIAEEAFRKISGVRVKWLSLEPLLAPLEFSDLSMFDFIVIGSQSATEQPDGHIPEFAPPFEWVARLTEQAHAAGCRVYQKPNLLGVTDPQHAGMKLIQEVPDLPPLPRSQGMLELGEAAE